MSRFSIVASEPGWLPLGLTIICPESVIQRHSHACAPGLWAVRYFEVNTHRVDSATHAVIDDFGDLCEVSQ